MAIRVYEVSQTHLAIGLGVEALKKGHKVSFITMDGLIHLLKTEAISRASQYKMRHIYRSDLVIIDELMFLAMDRHEANLFFQSTNYIIKHPSF
ncbi:MULTISPECIES: ATP-binding protein [unclassified Paenibacillus]|uniref:ATP-binding protein n=1 Tax=Paenibacillus TaxID=44249 RepID=UPI0035614BFC